MGRWSRAVAPHFLQWIAPARRRKWLDIGCGTGILAEAVLDLCDPLAVVGIDQSTAQVRQAERGPAGQRAIFQQAEATDLPFPDASFDVVVSALVLNFIPRPALAVQEMRRVARPGGVVSGYVWDFGKDLSPSGPLRRAMRSVGAEVPDIPGTAYSSEQALRSLLAEAG
ncbi:MAG TPA: methyltransferase domain-containing protein, partial [Burkholderiales bacterium]|nr:methyltransferase domain-containing protein [Burkholderiales bacterium]